jgi:resolvase-like protein
MRQKTELEITLRAGARGEARSAGADLRLSTREQTADTQERELRAAAERMGDEVVELYRDLASAGPRADRLHKDATHRRFDVVMGWSVDRLGRSLQDLVPFLEHPRETRCELFLHQQGLGTIPIRAAKAGGLSLRAVAPSTTSASRRSGGAWPRSSSAGCDRP